MKIIRNLFWERFFRKSYFKLLSFIGIGILLFRNKLLGYNFFNLFLIILWKHDFRITSDIYYSCFFFGPF